MIFVTSLNFKWSIKIKYSQRFTNTNTFDKVWHYRHK